MTQAAARPPRGRLPRRLPKRVERSRWRRKVRSRPQWRRAYRIGVAVTGFAIMLIAISIGWLPGPGGIPLFLVGLAVLATEFVWAARLLWRANHEAHRLGSWTARQPRWVHVLGMIGLGLAILGGIWLGLSVFGLPGWMPDVLDALPGVDAKP